MSINKKTVDNAIFECERFLERAKLVASLGYINAGVRYTAALKRSCAEVRNAVVAVRKEEGQEAYDERMLEYARQRQKLWDEQHKGGSDE